jgi:hypothetical protein
MNRLDCVKYLVHNAARGSEWQEAGMFDAVCRVMNEDEKTFGPLGLTDEEKIAWLEDLIETARNF